MCQSSDGQRRGIKHPPKYAAKPVWCGRFLFLRPRELSLLPLLAERKLLGFCSRNLPLPAAADRPCADDTTASFLPPPIRPF